MHIETERVLLRDFRESDLADLHAIFGDVETMRYVEPPYTLEKTRGFLLDFCIAQKKAFAAVHKSSGKMIGYVLFKPYGEPEVYEIGWIFHRDFWRQGYASEICGALLNHAFTEMNVHKIFAEAIDGVRSVGLMKKLGMQLEGVQRSQTRDHDGNWSDLYLYGMLREDCLRSRLQLCCGTKADIDGWMALVSSVADNFPGLETDEAISDHRNTVLKFMSRQNAICVKSGATIAGVMLFSTKRNMICCLAVSPEFRRMGVASLLMDEALSRLDRSRDITVSTFRAEDPLSKAPRALYRKYGFTEGKLLMEFGYPNQELILPAKQEG